MDIVERGLVPRASWSDMSEAEHFVQFFESDAFLLDSLRGFIGNALRAGDAGIVIATQAHRAGLEERLREDGVDVEHALERGQYVPLDAAAVLPAIMVDGKPDAERFTGVVGEVVDRAAEGGRHVAIFGEMVALLWASGKRSAATRLEALWNDLRKTRSFSLFCTYPLSGFEGKALAAPLEQVCAEHTRVIPGESYTALTSPEERLRMIVQLQQQARSLEAEIAERKAAEAALSEALRLRDEFLCAISHDLKTPLTVLQGQAQLLRRRVARGALDKEVILSALEQIEKRSRSMTKLVHQLLDVSQLHAGAELELDRRMVDLVALVRDEVDGQEETTDRHRLLVRAEEPELIGHWDRLRVGRVVENLLSNAIKYSPEGGEIAVVLSRESGPEGDWAILSVQDRGVGIAADDLPHIFERFYRGKNAADGIVGTGLGLAGTRHIIEQHGGAISVDSRPGGGSTFTVRLPISPP